LCCQKSTSLDTKWQFTINCKLENNDNFADFDAHFSTFGSDLGMPTRAPPGDDEEEDSPPAPASAAEVEPQEELAPAESVEPAGGQSVQDNIVRSDDQQAEYDNNANVEKAISDKLAESSVVETASIVTRLQSVLLDGEEDYEDDEGMWTKPLGADRPAESEQTTPISNGPTSKINEL